MIRRKAFGKELARHDTVQKDIADCRIEIEQTRVSIIPAITISII